MTLIPVEFLSITDDPGYATPEAAIAASMAHPLQPMAQEAGSLFAGREFVTAWCTPDEWVLEFTGPLWLRIVAERSGVRWSVERGRPDVPSVNEPYTLEWD